MSTVVFDCDSRPIARNTSCIAGACPSISGASTGVDGASETDGVCAVARRINATA
jgi:hypothetical protein